MRPKVSIATMVIIIIIMTVSSVLGIVGTVVYHYYHEGKWLDFNNAINLEADQISLSLALAIWNLEYQQISKQIESQMQNQRYAGIVIDMENFKRFTLSRDEQGVVQSRDSAFTDNDIIMIQRKIIFLDQYIGSIKIYATIRYFNEELSQGLALFMVLTILLDVVLTMGLYLSIQRLILRPLRIVERYADEVAHGAELTVKLSKLNFPGELDRLTRSIDAMVRNTLMRNQELKNSTERFQSVIQLLPIPLALYNDQGHLLLLNNRFVATFGYSITDIPHVNDWFAKAYPDPLYRQKVIDTWQREVEHAKRYGLPIRTLTCQVKCANGAVKFIEIGGIISENVNIAVLNDITDRTLAEVEIERYREHLEELVTTRTTELANTYQRLDETQFAMDRAGIGIIWLDPLNGHCTYVNDQACELTGIAREKFLMMPIITVATEFTRTQLRRLAIKLIQIGFTRIETIITRADANRLPVEAALYFKAPSDDQPGHYIVFFTDITQRKEVETALIAAKMAAEASAKARSEFLANMSHEIRTPMNAIIGMSQLALQTELNKKQRNYIEKVHLSAISLLGILNDILDFSKVEAGRLEIEHIEFTLERIFDNLANLVGLRAEAKGIELLFHIALEPSLQLIGDPLRLGQILINLTGNAVKFTESGTVVVACREINRSSNLVDLEFSVRDTGIGMNEAQVASLFTPFQQGDNSISRRYGGTGLGLAICKRLTELMGGSITVQSKLDQGSIFTFTSPFGIPNNSQADTTIRQEILRGERVLVVDDNPDALKIMSNMIVNFGMEVDRATSAREALAMLQQVVHYRLLVCDWKMPGMDGIELVRTLNAMPGVRIPSTIIMVSAYGIDELRRKAADLPLAGFLTKPVSPSSVLDVMLTATGQMPVEQPAHRLVAREIPRTSSLAGTTILLVDDNAINQELAYELLQSEGATVTVANNGQEALDQLAHDTFDFHSAGYKPPPSGGIASALTLCSLF